MSTTAAPHVDSASPEPGAVLRGCVHRQVGYRMSGDGATSPTGSAPSSA